MRFYETTIVLSPQSDETAVGHEIDRITQTITADDGKVVLAQCWGIKRLAYPIQKFSQANYVHFVYQAPPAVPGKLEAGFRINESILRHLTVLVEGPLASTRMSEVGPGVERDAVEESLAPADEAFVADEIAHVSDEPGMKGVE